jgi:hypothetical protein
MYAPNLLLVKVSSHPRPGLDQRYKRLSGLHALTNLHASASDDPVSGGFDCCVICSQPRMLLRKLSLLDGRQRGSILLSSGGNLPVNHFTLIASRCAL